MLLNRRRRGFTLIEVLVAVAILGLVAVGALKLMIISTRGLAELNDSRRFLQLARQTQLDFMSSESKSSKGKDKDEDYSWETVEQRWSVLDDRWEVIYRELRVTYKGQTMSLYLSNLR